jgi:hypothetical protein
MLQKSAYLKHWNLRDNMAKRAEIRCVNKNPRLDPHERITHVGGFVDKQWKITTDQAISFMETPVDADRWTFYVTRGGRTAEVIVASRNGRKYLKTENDGLTPDNLLSLPECP